MKESKVIRPWPTQQWEATEIGTCESPGTLRRYAERYGLTMLEDLEFDGDDLEIRSWLVNRDYVTGTFVRRINGQWASYKQWKGREYLSSFNVNWEQFEKRIQELGLFTLEEPAPDAFYDWWLGDFATKVLEARLGDQYRNFNWAFYKDDPYTNLLAEVYKMIEKTR